MRSGGEVAGKTGAGIGAAGLERMGWLGFARWDRVRGVVSRCGALGVDDSLAFQGRAGAEVGCLPSPLVPGCEPGMPAPRAARLGCSGERDGLDWPELIPLTGGPFGGVRASRGSGR